MIDAPLVGFVVALATCAGFIVRAPGFSHPAVPMTIRATAAFVLAVALAAQVESARLSQTQLTVAAVGAFLTGAGIGFAGSLLYEGASAGGKLLDAFVGVQLANPTAQVASGDGFGALFGVTFLAAFFFLDGYQPLVVALGDALRSAPLADPANASALRAFAIGLPVVVLRAAVLVAGPAICVGIVAQIGLGAVARVVPRFSNLTLSFPIVFGTVLLAAIVTTPLLVGIGARPVPIAPFLAR